jgi:hypothetical protein
MVAKLVRMSEIDPITDEESDALTREWNADFEDHEQQQDERRAEVREEAKDPTQVINAKRLEQIDAILNKS